MRTLGTRKTGTRNSLGQIFFAAALALTLGIAGGPVVADANVAVGAGDLTGSRSTPSTSGIVGLSGWSVANGGMKIAWVVFFDGTDWNYAYTFTNATGGALTKGVSHMLLEVSTVITSANVDDFISGNAFVVGTQTWTLDGAAPS